MELLVAVNENPMAAALVITALLLVQSIVKAWKGKNSDENLERESNKLAKQTSETVNRCAARTSEIMDQTTQLMDTVRKYMETNDIGHVRTQLDISLPMLEKMVENQNLALGSLARIVSISSGLHDDFKVSDIRVTQEQVKSELVQLKSLANDIKQKVNSM